MTTWQVLVMAVGVEWANAIWPVAKNRSGLLYELEAILPRWQVRLRGDGTSDMYDAHAASRAAWLSARANDVDAVASMLDA